ncbi:MAG: DUF1592 domain-containing protein [Myxococcota bacterium]|nr:DUF1592 domain-containing protein [Myxococcota bacterium]MEC9391493.1 DUF1592 domain-containing protein [Myxococcota bacterium]
MTRIWLCIGLVVGCGSDDKADPPASDADSTSPDPSDSSDAPADTGADTGEAGCPEDVDLFEARVWEPVLSTHCYGCHAADGIAQGTRMVFDEDDMLQNLRAASAVSDLLLVKPTGLDAVGHGGGTLVWPETDAWDALSFWVDWTKGICDATVEACTDEPIPRRLWRLDHDQYERTVMDLLGVSTDYGEHLAPDTAVDGYRNDAEALVISGLLADQYRNAAEDLASVADIAGMLTCAPSDGQMSQCAATFIEDFGSRAFRRPIGPDEIETYLDLWADIAEEDGFFEGLRWVVAGMLQSPHFLYRSELGTATGGGAFTLTDWEIASELSYLLWGTMPDDALFASAAAGELNTPDQIGAHVDRMMADDRALNTTAQFVDAWLQLDRIDSIARVGWSGPLQQAMKEQTHETVKEIARLDRSLSDLMLSPTTYIPDALADHYGMDASGWVDQDGETYGGLLTHGSLLSVYALGEASSPVHRGVVVRERMLCEELPPPPPNLDTSPPAADADGTTREKYAVHSSLPECASCHSLIDPIGFGFEHYDHLGRWRTTEVGQPIDASGDLDGVVFDGAPELSELLTEDPRFRACFVESWRRWGMGGHACADDEGDVSLTGPLAELPQRVAFTTRTGDASGSASRAVGNRLTDDALRTLAEAFGEVLPGGATSGVEFTLIESTTWTTGFCADATVTNTTDAPVVWEAREEVMGTITSIWNAEYRVEGDVHVFTGVEWNAELPAYGSTTFGFCGAR